MENLFFVVICILVLWFGVSYKRICKLSILILCGYGLVFFCFLNDSSSNFLYQNINVSTTFELNEISIDSSFKQQFYKITPEKSGITHFFSNSSEEVRKILLKLKSNKFYEFSEIFRRIEKNAIDVLSLKMRIDLNINQQLKDHYQKHREFDMESNEFLQNIHPKEIILCLTKSLDEKKQLKLGERIIEAGYPITLFYRYDNEEYIFNDQLFLRSFLVSDKPLIASFSTNSISAQEFKDFNTYAFFLGDRLEKFNSPTGYLDKYSIDLYRELFYTNISEKIKNNEFMLATINGFNTMKNFLNGFMTIINFAAVNLFHINANDIHLYFEKGENSEIGYIFNILKNKTFIENRGYFVLMIKKNDSIGADILIKLNNGIKKIFHKQFKGFVLYDQSKELYEENGRNHKWLDINEMIIKKIQPFLHKNEFYLHDSDIIIKFYNEKNKTTFKIKDNYITVDDYYNLLQSVQKFSQSPPQNIELYLKKKTQLKNQLFYFSEIRRKISIYRIKLDNLKKETEKNINNEKLTKEFNNTLVEIEKLKRSIEKTSLNPIIYNFLSTFINGNNMNYWKASNAISHWISPTLKFLFESLKKSSKNQTQMNLLSADLNDKDISIETFLVELFNSIDLKNSFDYIDYKNLATEFIKNKILSEEPLNLINEDLHFGSKILKSIFNDLNLQGEINVISILGPQSSGKSTLLNYLFGAGFKVESGRCTKGVYFTLFKNVFKNRHILLIDTEGLMTTFKGRDGLFDNQIATLIFSISNIVILNHKGEFDRNMKHLVEVSNYALKVLDLNDRFKPHIFLVMHGMVDRNRVDEESQKNKIIQELNDLNPELKNEKNLYFKSEHVFLFPPPFGEENWYDEIDLFKLYDKYGKKCLNLRIKLLQSLSRNNSYGLIEFYEKTNQNWKIIKKYGSSLMRAKSLLQRNALESGVEVTRQISLDLINNNKKIQNLVNSINNFTNPSFLKDRKEFYTRINEVFLELKTKARKKLEDALSDKDIMKFLDDDNYKELQKRLEFQINLVEKTLYLLYVDNYFFYERSIETKRFLQNMAKIFQNSKTQDRDKMINNYKKKYMKYIEKEENKAVDLKENTKVAVVRKFKEVFHAIKQKTQLKEYFLQDYLDLEYKLIIDEDYIKNNWLFCYKRCNKQEVESIIRYFNDFLTKMKAIIKDDCVSDNKIIDILMNLDSHFKGYKNPKVRSLTPKYKDSLLHEIVSSYYLCQYQKKLEEIDKNILKLKNEMKEVFDSIGLFGQSSDDSEKLGILFSQTLMKITIEHFMINNTKSIEKELSMNFFTPEKLIDIIYEFSFHTKVKKKYEFYLTIEYIYNLSDYIIEFCIVMASDRLKKIINSQSRKLYSEFFTDMEEISDIFIILNGTDTDLPSFNNVRKIVLNFEFAYEFLDKLVLDCNFSSQIYDNLKEIIKTNKKSPITHEQSLNLILKLLAKIKETLKSNVCSSLEIKFVENLIQDYEKLENINLNLLINMLFQDYPDAFNLFDSYAKSDEFNEIINSFDIFLKSLETNMENTIKEEKDNLIDNIIKVIMEKIENKIHLKRREIVGCPAQCPICKAKCDLPDDGHTHHHSNHHLFHGFFGFTNRKNQASLTKCTEKNSDDEEYDGHKKKLIDYISDVTNGTWNKTIKNDKDFAYENENENAMKIAWLGLKDILLDFMKMEDGTPSEWNKLLDNDKRLTKNDISTERKSLLMSQIEGKDKKIIVKTLIKSEKKNL